MFRRDNAKFNNETIRQQAKRLKYIYICEKTERDKKTEEDTDAKSACYFYRKKRKGKKKSYNLRWPLRRPQRTSRNTIRREDMSGKEEGERKKREEKRKKKTSYRDVARAPRPLSYL